MVFGQKLNSRKLVKRLAKALIRLRVCWSHIPHSWKSHITAHFFCYIVASSANRLDTVEARQNIGSHLDTTVCHSNSNVVRFFFQNVNIENQISSEEAT